VRTARSIDERLETAGSVPNAPAMEARPTDPESERRRDPLVPGNPDAMCAEADLDQAAPGVRSRWPATAGREEQEAGTFLIRVTKETTVRHGTVPDGPRRVTQAEFRTAFLAGWTVDSIVEERFAARLPGGGAQAWLTLLTRV
jgi:hypothetical protein